MQHTNNKCTNKILILQKVCSNYSKAAELGLTQFKCSNYGSNISSDPHLFFATLESTDETGIPNCNDGSVATLTNNILGCATPNTLESEITKIAGYNCLPLTGMLDSSNNMPGTWNCSLTNVNSNDEITQCYNNGNDGGVLCCRDYECLILFFL